MPISFSRVGMTCLIALLCLSQAAQGKVFIRQGPEVTGDPTSERVEPAPGKLSGYAFSSNSLAPTAASWAFEVDEGGEPLRAKLRAEFSYDQPPLEMRPGDTISLRMSGTLSGHVYGKHLTPSLTLAVGEDSSKPLKNGILGLHNRDLPVVDDPDHYSYYTRYQGEVSATSEATFVVPDTAGDGFAISAHFYGQSVIWRYREVAEAADSLPINLCTDGSELQRVLDEIDKLDRIKDNPALYEAEVGFANEPFEICIADGKATLKGEPQTMERAAGIASMLLSAYMGAAADKTTIIGAIAAGDTGGYAGDQAGTFVSEAVRDMGSRASVQAIKDSARRSEIAGELAKSGMSSVFSDYTPEKIGESFAQNPTKAGQQSLWEELMGGHLELSAEQGLAVYRELQLINEIARVNAKKYYCSIQGAQYQLMQDIRNVANALDASAEDSCREAVEKERGKLEFAFRKIRHDLLSASSPMGWDREYGYNWTLAAKYQGYDCTRELAAKAKNQRFYD